MKIAVCIKFVPETENPRMDINNNLVREGVTHMVNIADEAALETALKLRGCGSVTILTMGTLSCREALRSLLARGADDAVLLSDSCFAGADTYITALTLSRAISKMGGFDVILCGRRAIDGETGQVPPALAVFCGIPFITNATSVSYTDGYLDCSRLLEHGTELLRAPLPALISVCEYSNSLRLPSIKGMRRAKETQITVMDHTSLEMDREICGLQGSPTRVFRVEKGFHKKRRAQLSFTAAEGARCLEALIQEVNR